MLKKAINNQWIIIYKKCPRFFADSFRNKTSLLQPILVHYFGISKCYLVLLNNPTSIPRWIRNEIWSKNLWNKMADIFENQFFWKNHLYLSLSLYLYRIFGHNYKKLPGYQQYLNQLNRLSSAQVDRNRLQPINNTTVVVREGSQYFNLGSGREY